MDHILICSRHHHSMRISTDVLYTNLPYFSSLDDIKASVQNFMESRNGSLAPLYERKKGFILIGIARQPFI